MACKLPPLRSGDDAPACSHSRAKVFTGYTMATGSTGFHESPEKLSEGTWDLDRATVSLMKELGGALGAAGEHRFTEGATLMHATDVVNS